MNFKVRLKLAFVVFIYFFSNNFLSAAESESSINDQLKIESNSALNELDEQKDFKKLPLFCALGASELRTWVKLRMPEFFYGKNLRLLNDNNPTDRVLFFRHTLDINTEYRYFNPNLEYDIIFAKMNIRNKGVWGDPESIASTTRSNVKILDSVIGNHSHAIPRHIFWIRELWIQIALNELFYCPLDNYHTLTFGSFPFELGRGISLGASFAVDPSDLGFYSETAVDQYAFGGKLSGVVSKDCLLYDLYAAILNNKSASFGQTNEKIKGQQFGRRNNQARGFGVINYVLAGRLRWAPFSGFAKDVYLEPYVLYNRNPEQRIEFLGDSKSNLVTLGLASEAVVGNFEWGFDTAFNFGNQKVFGWDTNVIRLENRDGFLVEVNSKVHQAQNDDQTNLQKSPLALNVSENQEIIDTSKQSASQNGQIIGSDELGILVNDNTRFVDGYKNKFRGSMFVFDLGYYFRKPDLKICGAFGYASGDKNPNRDLEELGDSQVDRDYFGFIGLQETYSGTRVKSAFLLSGAGKIPRLLSFPSESAKDPFVSTVSRFTNLIFTGSSIKWQPCWNERKWVLNPNLLFYWQEDPSRFFNEATQISSENTFADTFLGVELNLFAEAEILDGLRLFSVTSFFFPGSHYDDVKGRPLNKSQKSFIDKMDQTGIDNDRTPLLGKDTAFFANIGLEYKF